jgi:phosphatidylserine/phosphatidylglycerophosphate/cardiolipin synthase-like enzyme
MTPGALEIAFLQDGAQPAEQVAEQLGAFLEAAQHTLEIAIYDLNLHEDAQARLARALGAAAARGVAIRLLYNVDFRNPIPVPPPTQPNLDFIAALPVQSRGISGVPALMHHKFVVRDFGAPTASVWTGSTNWTSDSWTREENVIVQLAEASLAAAYRRDFEQLWSGGRVDQSGAFDSPEATLGFADQPVAARVVFSPGRGAQMAHLVAGHLGRAQRRVRIASPVITAGPILGTLGELVDRRGAVDIAGVYDRTQMAEVLRQWKDDPRAGWKAPAFRAIVQELPFASKVTTPYAPGSVHDFMHAKVTVVDDTVLTGSYNLSHSGEENAENLLELTCAPLADRCAAYIDELRKRYGAA